MALTDNLATEYADTLAQQIREDVEAGTPFGLSYSDDGTEESRTALDYLEAALEWTYVVSSDKNYRSGRILIAYGGPTAWINTNTRQLEVTWGRETVYRELPREFVDELDATLEALYQS